MDDEVKQKLDKILKTRNADQLQKKGASKRTTAPNIDIDSDEEDLMIKDYFSIEDMVEGNTQQSMTVRSRNVSVHHNRTHTTMSSKGTRL